LQHSFYIPESVH
jgi:hypothetical protein